MYRLFSWEHTPDDEPAGEGRGQVDPGERHAQGRRMLSQLGHEPDQSAPAHDENGEGEEGHDAVGEQRGGRA